MGIEISVIIPSYNRWPMLARALNSVAAQQWNPQETIVVDDGSTDQTAHFMARSFPWVRYLRQTHSGVSAARNRGIRQAQADWLAFLDSDDTWHPDKLKQQCQALLSAPHILFCHTDEIWIRNGQRINPAKKHKKRGGCIFADCLPLCKISPSSTLIHRSVFDNLGLFDESLPACEDYDMWLRICASYPVLFVDQHLLTKFGGHADQLSRQHWGMDRFRIKAIAGILASGRLSSAQTQAAVAQLNDKIGIYINGLLKRHKTKEIAYWQSLQDRYNTAAK